MEELIGLSALPGKLPGNLFRVALGQSFLFLTTPDASRLALACTDLTMFLENAAAEGGLWNACKFERAKFSQGLIWLHPMLSLKDAGRFAMRAHSLRLRGGATFKDQRELQSIGQIVQSEAAYAQKVGDVVDTFSKRFLFAWNFHSERIADLLENGSVREVVSDDVICTCRHGISFALNLAVSKASSGTSELTFRVLPLKMIGPCRSTVEIKVCGYILAPDPKSSIVRLKRILGGTRVPQTPAIVEEEPDEASPAALDSKRSTEWLHFSRLLSVIRIHIFPISLCMGPVSLQA